MTQAKVEFFANVTHEFRTPLTLINSYLEVMLLSNSMSPENYRNLNGALANTTKLRDMINEFIDASKSDGQIRLNMTYSFVRSFVYEYYTVFADYAQQKNINLVFESNVDENHSSTLLLPELSSSRSLRTRNICISASKITDVAYRKGI